MNPKIKIAIVTGILAIYLFTMISLASAILVDVNYIAIYPGESGSVKIDVENNENFDIKDVSVALDLTNLPFSVVGSSEKDLDDLNEDDDDSASFSLKANTDITPGDYNILYVVKYKNADEPSDSVNNSLRKTGGFGIRVSAKTELSFTAETQTNVIGQQGKLSLKIINSGLGDIRFVNAKISPSGYTLLSSNENYIGTVASDDFETATFDVIFNQENVNLNAVVSYKDFDNKEQIQNLNIPVQVYTRERALELGIIKKNNTTIYVGIVIILIILWFVYRSWRKRQKSKNKLGR
ncbi:MAG: hypothetical protein AABX30_01710 [Nanoarchaeota archaeon]